MENSQLGTKVSGIEMKSTGKRDSLLARAEEPKNKSTPTKIPSAKVRHVYFYWSWSAFLTD